MDLVSISKLPIVRQAIADAAAADDAAAASARKAVLDRLAMAESVQHAIAGKLAQCDAEAGLLKAQLAALAERRIELEYQDQRANLLRVEAARELRQDHGEALYHAVVGSLRGRVAHLRRESGYQKSLCTHAVNIFGNAIHKPYPPGQQNAVVIEQQASEIERAIDSIACLVRAPIAPNEMRCRIDTALRELGMTVSETGRVEEIKASVDLAA